MASGRVFGTGPRRGRTPRGHRSGTGARGDRSDGSGLREGGSIRAAPPAGGRLGICHRDEVTHSIAIAYNFICNLFPSSHPSFAIRCSRVLKTLCGRLEIVDRRDDHALISAAGHHRYPRRCHRTTIARRPATRTRGRPTEAQESRSAAQDVPVLPLACGPARRPALSLWVANYYSARNPLRLSSLVILGVVARMFRCATRSSCWCT